MIALYILLIILLLLVFICLIRIRVEAKYVDEIKVILKILLLDFQLVPYVEKPEKKSEKKKSDKKKQKPEEEEKKEETTEKKQSYLSKLKDKKGVTGLISLFTEVAKIAGGTLQGIFRHIVIKKLIVGIALNSGDAASTAVDYGKMCSVVYPAVNVITSICICKDYSVTLEPIFDDERSTEAYAEISAYIRVGFILWYALKAGVKLLIARIKM